MDITPLVPQGRKIIQSYAADGFRVSGQAFSTPIIVFADRVVAWDVPVALDDITADHFQPLVQSRGDLDVVLMGCGKSMGAIPFALRQRLKESGITVDFMDTGAACRTYNVLMAEGRRVAVALLPAL